MWCITSTILEIVVKSKNRTWGIGKKSLCANARCNCIGNIICIASQFRVGIACLYLYVKGSWFVTEILSDCQYVSEVDWHGLDGCPAGCTRWLQRHHGKLDYGTAMHTDTCRRVCGQNRPLTHQWRIYRWGGGGSQNPEVFLHVFMNITTDLHFRGP